MKEAIIVNLDGYMIDVDLVDDAVTGVFPIYKQPEPAGIDQEPQPEEATPPPEPEIIGYTVSVPVPPGLYKPRFDFAAWDAYLEALETTYHAEMVAWINTPEEDRGDQPVLEQPSFWVEGLTQEEIDALKNQPVPESQEQKIARLEDELTATKLANLDTMDALFDVYLTVLDLQTAGGE